MMLTTRYVTLWSDFDVLSGARRLVAGPLLDSAEAALAARDAPPRVGVTLLGTLELTAPGGPAVVGEVELSDPLATRYRVVDVASGDPAYADRDPTPVLVAEDLLFERAQEVMLVHAGCLRPGRTVAVVDYAGGLTLALSAPRACPRAVADWRADPDYRSSPSDTELLLIDRVFDGGWRWQLNQRSHHRVVAPDGTGGSWVGYSFVATSSCGTRAAATQYFSGTLPTERVFCVAPLEDAP